MNFSIIIPLYNEEGNIKILCDEILREINKLDKHIFEIILVNDQSKDETLKTIIEIKNEHPKLVKVINNLENCGQSKSLLNGILASKYDDIITLDGDLQNDPSDLPNLINNYVLNSDISLIGGIRVKRKDNIIKRITSLIANNFRSALLKDNCSDTGCGLKIFNKKIFLRLPFFDGIHRFLPALFKGYDQKTLFINVNHRSRLKGLSKYGTLRRLVYGLIDTYKVYKIINKPK